MSYGNLIHLFHNSTVSEMNLWVSVQYSYTIEEIHFRNCYLNGFGTFDPGDLDLWPNDSDINRGSLPPRMDVWIKFEEGR